LSYYPGVVEPQSASLIEVRSGAESTADFNVHRQEFYKFVAALLIREQGRGPQRHESGWSLRILARQCPGKSKVTYNPTDGTFEVRDVPPGSYVARAQIPEANRTAIPGKPPGTSEGITISQLDLSNYVPPAMASTRVTVSKLGCGSRHIEDCCTGFKYPAIDD